MEIERESLGPGEMDQWLREGSIFREDPSSVFSPQVRGLADYATLALTHLTLTDLGSAGFGIHLYAPTWTDRHI